MLPRKVSRPRRRAYCREVPARGHHGVGGLRIPATCIACNPTRREGGVEPPQPGLCSPGRHRCSRRGKSLERGCGRRPSRSALEMIGVLPLMLRTQPPSENWPGGSCTRVDACLRLPPIKFRSRSRRTCPLSRFPARHQSIFGGSAKLDRSPYVANSVLAFFHDLRRNRTGEAKSTGPNTGFEIFVRGVRTYSLDESSSRLRERQSHCAIASPFLF